MVLCSSAPDRWASRTMKQLGVTSAVQGGGKRRATHCWLAARVDRRFNQSDFLTHEIRTESNRVMIGPAPPIDQLACLMKTVS
jgi:hypothetical protein